MKTKIVKIGNAKGIRLPKAVIEQTGLDEEVEIQIKDGKIIIQSVKKERADWDSAFEKMAQNNDDILLDEEILSDQSSWDNTEWEW